MNNPDDPRTFIYAPTPEWPKRPDASDSELAIISVPAKDFGPTRTLFAIRRWQGSLPQLFTMGYVRKMDAERDLDRLLTDLDLDRAFTLRAFRTRFADTLAPIPPHDSTGECHICRTSIDHHNAHDLRRCTEKAFAMIHGEEPAK